MHAQTHTHVLAHMVRVDGKDAPVKQQLSSTLYLLNCQTSVLCLSQQLLSEWAPGFINPARYWQRDVPGSIFRSCRNVRGGLFYDSLLLLDLTRASPDKKRPRCPSDSRGFYGWLEAATCAAPLRAPRETLFAPSTISSLRFSFTNKSHTSAFLSIHLRGNTC